MKMTIKVATNEDTQNDVKNNDINKDHKGEDGNDKSTIEMTNDM